MYMSCGDMLGIWNVRYVVERNEKLKQGWREELKFEGVVEGQAGKAMRKRNDEVKVLEEELHRERPAAREQSLQDRKGRLGPNGDQVGP